MYCENLRKINFQNRVIGHNLFGTIFLKNKLQKSLKIKSELYLYSIISKIDVYSIKIYFYSTIRPII